MRNVLPLIRLLVDNKTVTVSFLREDKTVTTLRCALRNGQVNRYTITVWDIDKRAYRDIPKAQIVSYI